MRHTIPSKVIAVVIERDRSTCQVCGMVGTPVIRFGKPAAVENPEGIILKPGMVANDRRLIKFELHHKIPVFMGGDNSPDNLELRCRTCNRSETWFSYASKLLRR